VTVDELYTYLDENGIAYEKIEHPPVFTCEEAEAVVPPFDGAHTKNLFIKDKKGRNHFLVTTGYEKSVDIKALGALLEVKGLSFGSPERLQQRLGVEPGSVTLLAVVNDTERAVEVVIDADLWQSEKLGCHPLTNSATLVIPRDDLSRFLVGCGHEPRIVEVPSRA